MCRTPDVKSSRAFWRLATLRGMILTLFEADNDDSSYTRFLLAGMMHFGEV